MKPMGNQRDHYWLVQRMAKALGCDTVQAMEDGTLNASDWSDMVTRCRGCQATCACKLWLSRAELDTAPRAEAMDGCENALVFAAI